jgi:hypothetical protein
MCLCKARDPDAAQVNAATEAMYHPPLPPGLSCTIKQRRVPSKLKEQQLASAPAPHDYDVVRALAKLNKEPSYSFGKVSAPPKERLPPRTCKPTPCNFKNVIS